MTGRAGATAEGFVTEATVHDKLPGEGIAMAEGVNDIERTEVGMSREATARAEELCDPTLQFTMRGYETDVKDTPCTVIVATGTPVEKHMTEK